MSVLILGLLGAGAARLLTSDLQSNRNLLTYQRLRRQISRTRRFLELESASGARLQAQNANRLSLSGLNNGTAYTITYDLVAAAAAGVSGVTFRGPYVLRRQGPPYTSNGTLSSSPSTATVLLDGLQNNQAFTVNASQSAAARSAAVSINLSERDASYTSNFSLTTAAPSGYGLLQFTGSFVSTCGTGCRETDGIQEWDTRLLGSSSTITVTPVGNPSQVIIYFNAPRPTAADAIRRAQASFSGSCNRNSCFVDFPSGSDYVINSASRRVDKLVFLDSVIAVPR